MDDVGEPAVKFIVGNDSEEILSELLELFGPRPIVKFHRAVLQNNIQQVAKELEDSPHLVNSTLLPMELYDEVEKANMLDFAELQKNANVVKQTDEYPPVEQIETGNNGRPNELYPSGEMDMPETNLDSVFWSPLMRACQIGSVKMVKLLLSHNADVNYKSRSNCNCLFILLSGDEMIRDADILKILPLITTEENKNDVAYTHAIICSETPQPKALELMLQLGFPVSETYLSDVEGLSEWLDLSVVQVLRNYVASRSNS